MDDDQHDAHYHASDNQEIHRLPPPSFLMCITGNAFNTGPIGSPLVTGDPQSPFQKHASCDMTENQRPNTISALLVGQIWCEGRKRASLVRKSTPVSRGAGGVA
jgi:hypothetical protein